MKQYHWLQELNFRYRCGSYGNRTPAVSFILWSPSCSTVLDHGVIHILMKQAADHLCLWDHLVLPGETQINGSGRPFLTIFSTSSISALQPGPLNPVHSTSTAEPGHLNPVLCNQSSATWPLNMVLWAQFTDSILWIWSIEPGPLKPVHQICSLVLKPYLWTWTSELDLWTASSAPALVWSLYFKCYNLEFPQEVQNKSFQNESSPDLPRTLDPVNMSLRLRLCSQKVSLKERVFSSPRSSGTKGKGSPQHGGCSVRYWYTSSLYDDPKLLLVVVSAD